MDILDLPEKKMGPAVLKELNLSKAFPKPRSGKILRRAESRATWLT
jgi:acyl-coenzyme A synthetase/AMP-(fatty) acid ligase